MLVFNSNYWRHDAIPGLRASSIREDNIDNNGVISGLFNDLLFLKYSNKNYEGLKFNKEVVDKIVDSVMRKPKLYKLKLMILHLLFHATLEDIHLFRVWPIQRL